MSAAPPPPLPQSTCSNAVGGATRRPSPPATANGVVSCSRTGSLCAAALLAVTHSLVVVFLEAHSGLGGAADSFAHRGRYSFDSGLPLFSELSPPPAELLPSGHCHCVYATLEERTSGGGGVTASRRALSRHKGGALSQTMDAVLSQWSVWDVVKAFYSRTVGAYIPAKVHLSRLLESCGLASLTHRTDWVRLFERHPEFEMVDVDTIAVLHKALSDLRRQFEAPNRHTCLALLFFTSYGGSGKSRTCGKLVTLVSRVRRSVAAGARRATPHRPARAARPPCLPARLPARPPARPPSRGGRRAGGWASGRVGGRNGGDSCGVGGGGRGHTPAACGHQTRSGRPPATGVRVPCGEEEKGR